MSSESWTMTFTLYTVHSHVDHSALLSSTSAKHFYRRKLNTSQHDNFESHESIQETALSYLSKSWKQIISLLVAIKLAFVTSADQSDHDLHSLLFRQ